jgi:hypothetical protein
VQELGAFLVGALALGYLAWRHVRGRASGNCCGEAECPAAKATLDKLPR